MIKFIGGPVAGALNKLNVFETSLFTILGALTSVVVFTIIGDKFRERQRQKRIRKNKTKKVFSKRTRKVIRIYRKFGIYGIAFVTPLVLTPIGGTIVALSLGVPRRKILKAMIPMVIFWGVLLSFVVVVFWKELKDYIHH